MAGLNGMGPNNQGPMTGRGQGNCQGTAQVQGYGCGMGRGRGMGRGFGFNQQNVVPQNAMPQNDVGFLKNQAQILQNNLDAVNKRISEIEGN